jgi:competence protein ComEC
LWQGTAVGLAAQVFTIPLTLYYFHQFPNYFILSNVIVMTFAGLILGTGLTLFVMQRVWYLNGFLGIVLGSIISAMFVCLTWIQDFPGAVALGFDLSIMIVLLTYLFIIALIFTINMKWIRTGVILLIFLMIGIIQYNRYNDTIREELVVFNSNTPIIVVKQRNEIICLHELEERSKAEFITQAYLKVHPAQIRYEVLPSNKLTVKGKSTIKFERSNNGLLINTETDELYLRTGYGENPFKNSTVIDMPYLESKGGQLNLKSGAQKYSL